MDFSSEIEAAIEKYINDNASEKPGNDAIYKLGELCGNLAVSVSHSNQVYDGLNFEPLQGDIDALKELFGGWQHDIGWKLDCLSDKKHDEAYHIFLAGFAMSVNTIVNNPLIES